MSAEGESAETGRVDVVFQVRPEEALRGGGLAAAELARVAAWALEEGGRGGAELSLVLVDDPTLARMHGDHLGDPTPTDVISFDLGDDGHGPVGEVYVSVDRARAVAERRGVAFARELALYVVHGTLHLCGHDDGDEGERARMRAAEARVLARLGFPVDPGAHEEEP